MGAFDEAIAAREGQPKGAFDAAVSQREAPKKHTYSILPVSEDEAGRPHFDSNAGILGAIKRAVTLPGDVYTGKVDPNSHEGTKRAVEFATTFSPVNPAVRAGERAIPGALRAEKPVEVAPPTSDALKTAGGGAFEKARNLGVEYSVPAVNEMAEGIRQDLFRKGLLAKLAPETHSIIDDLANPVAGATAPFEGLHAARQALGKAAQNFNNPREQLAAARAIKKLDEFLQNPTEKSVVAGAPAAEEVGRLVGEGNANYAAAKRSEQLQGIEDSAELKAAAANSGANLDNTIRQRAVSLLGNRKARQGFSKEELAALDLVARGDKSRNALRIVGNLLGGGGGLGGAVTSAIGAAGGSSVGGPFGGAIGAMLPLVGYGAKSMANRKAMQALEAVDEMTRARSPLFTRMQEEAPMEAISPDGRALLTRALGMDALSHGHNQAMAELLGEPGKSRRKKKGR